MFNKKSILIYMLVILIITTQYVSVYANSGDGVLPSGINYSELDSYIEDYMNEFDSLTTGVALAVVNEDDTIYKKYSGKLDISNNIDVDENSVFEWGSVSKILVWISVMQLSEQYSGPLCQDHFLKKIKKYYFSRGRILSLKIT